MAAVWFRLLVLGVTLIVPNASLAVTADSAPPPSFRATLQAAASSSANLASVLLKVERTQRLLRKVRANLQTAAQDLEDSHDTAGHRALDTTRQDLLAIRLTEASLAKLMDLETYLASPAPHLDGQIERLAQAVRQLEVDLDQLAAESQRWTGLLNLAQERVAPVRLIEQGR